VSVTGLRRRVGPPRGGGGGGGCGDRPTTTLGARVVLNGTPLALFRYRGRPLAFDAACPHAGGDLAAGDIEDYGGATCVACPSHGFLFDVGSGASVVPAGRQWALRVYPARVEPDGAVAVGFPALGAGAFAGEEDF
jgi:nitrite reductase/ring-hydroxylating ferredoxin subunit